MASFNYNIFGFEIRRKEQQPALTPPRNDDGAIENEITASGGAVGYYLDLNKRLTNEVDLINKYRSLAMTPEIDNAIEDIVNEAIVVEEGKPPVTLDIQEVPELPQKIRDVITQEFNTITTLLKLHENGHDVFRNWYIDGRQYGQVIVDEQNLAIGIQEIRLLDSRKVKKVRDIIRKKNAGGADVVVGTEEYFLYTEQGNSSNTAATGIKLSPDTIVASTSGLTDEYNSIISYLHKAIKPANQLRYMEDAALIYTLSRAPARRVFYIDIADMPKQKADQYMQEIMNKYKNKVVYNSSSGEISDSRAHQTMLEDYWLPRRGNGRTTEITTLPSENITGQMDNVTYFLNKLYNALNIPISRLRQDMNFSLGRTNEITRDEVKFSKFIDRLRAKFSEIILQALRVQLVLKGIIAPEDWEFIRSKLNVTFARDNYFAELKENEILSSRLQMAEQIQPLVGQYYSQSFVSKKILRLTDEEIESMAEEIAEMQAMMQQQQQGEEK
jgi:cob(I)alamin adenosyltransferase